MFFLRKVFILQSCLYMPLVLRIRGEGTVNLKTGAGQISPFRV